MSDLRAHPGRGAGPRNVVVPVLAVGLIAVSTSAPMIEASRLPALVIATWRTLICAAVFGAWVLLRGRSARAARTPLTLSDHGRVVLAGALLAGHFALWISAFEHTSFAASVLLLVTQPVFGAVLGRLLYGERIGRRGVAALALSTVGLALLVRGDLDDPRGLLGDALAVLGSLSIALFYVVAKPLRRRMAFAPYMGAVFGWAGVMLAAGAWIKGDALLGHPPREWWIVAALVLVPTVIGHACFNWAVTRVRFFTLNVLIVLEPAIALLLGAVFLDTSARTDQLVGGLVLAAAVLVAVGTGRDNSPVTSAAREPTEEQPRAPAAERT